MSDYVLKVGHGLSGPGIRSGVPVLEGKSDVFSFLPAQPFARETWLTCKRDGKIVGAGCWSLGDRPLAALVREVYTELLDLMDGYALHRMWNFIPGINVVERGLERYRSFCLGRHEAFATHFGAVGAGTLPAASAVGSDGEDLVVWFIGGRDRGEPVENPEQIPAYQYPREYGPKPPAFCRAYLMRHDNGSPALFVSGTSGIVGHSTVAPGDCRAQTEIALRHIRRLITTGLGEATPPGIEVTAYLRDRSNHAWVRERIQSEWGNAADVVILRSDICRADLEVEIEVTAPGLATQFTQQTALVQTESASNPGVP